jgi:hypothetical protein
MMGKDEKLQILLLAALLVVCALVYVKAFMNTGGSRKYPLENIPDTIHPKENLANTSSVKAQQAQLEEKLAWGRDPFSGSSGSSTFGLTLSGIMWDAANPIAIINGSPVRAGEFVGKFQVKEILQDKVLLSDGVNSFEINISE